MENASKALIMAGGVLIGILIISLAVYLFIDFGSTSAQITAQNTQKQITEFNSKFTSYEGYTDITIYDIITLANYAKENNDYYKDVADEQITVRINNIDIIEKIEKGSALIDDDDYKDKKFSCRNIEYNNRGKVKSITFSVIQ